MFRVVWLSQCHGTSRGVITFGTNDDVYGQVSSGAGAGSLKRDPRNNKEPGADTDVILADIITEPPSSYHTCIRLSCMLVMLMSKLRQQK